MVLNSWDRTTMPPPASSDVLPVQAALSVARLSANVEENQLFETVDRILWASQRSDYSSAFGYLGWVTTHITDWRTGKITIADARSQLNAIETTAIENCDQACYW